MRALPLLSLLCLSTPALAEPFASLESLGEALFNDVNLSLNRSQACASCHMPDFGFVDARMAGPGGAVSLGDDGHSFGTRNAPMAAYAMLSPEFHQDKDGQWRGGQFLDGRAANLAEQAGGPPLNPVEMAMPSVAAVADRLRENPDYVQAFAILMDISVQDDAALFDAMTQAIAHYEMTPEFAAFDSKYDRFLRGEAELTDQEELGRVLFFSQQFTNCNQCHQLSLSALDPREPFTDYSYHNIGTPANPDLSTALGGELGRAAADIGLLGNPLVGDPAAAGQFKVPSLRNVAITGPYMHNGVFADLRTVVAFYNKYNSRRATAQINPETGQPWAAPEVPGTLSLGNLEDAPALDDQRIDALVAFMRTLTDARYEDLLD